MATQDSTSFGSIDFIIILTDFPLMISAINISYAISSSVAFFGSIVVFARGQPPQLPHLRRSVHPL